MNPQPGELWGVEDKLETLRFVVYVSGHHLDD